MYLMKNRIRTYAWGSRTAIASLVGDATPSLEPQAELWIGAHPGDSSSLNLAGGEQPLLQAIDQDPTGTLGPDVVRRFDGALPFLLKLLAADSPLSLQAHPSMTQARTGFDAEQAAGVPFDAPFRNYKDRSHKPEMIYALTAFEALCGFRPTAATVQLLDELLDDGAVPELAELRTELASQPAGTGLRRVVTTLLEADRSATAPTVQSVAAACRARLDRGAVFDREYKMAATLAEHYPGDPGVLIALLMNRIDLAPGEAVYLPAGNMHAYLSGFGVEIMASSDNVLRGGLTTKHVDVAELAAVVNFEPGAPDLIQPVPIGPSELAYRTPTPEFELSVITAQPGGRSVAHTGPQVLLVVEGSPHIIDTRGRRLTVRPGQSVFLPARQGPVWIQGTGTLVRARDGLLSTPVHGN